MPVEKPQFFRRDLRNSAKLHAPGILHLNSRQHVGYEPSQISYRHDRYDFLADLIPVTSSRTKTFSLDHNILFGESTEDPAKSRLRVAHYNALRPNYVMNVDSKSTARSQNMTYDYASDFTGITAMLTATLICAYVMKNNLS